MSANGLLEKYAIKYFEKRGLHFSIYREDVAEVALKTKSAGAVHIIVIGHENESSDRNAVSIFEFRVQSIAEFPGDRRASALATSNRINDQSIGHFLVDESGGMEYRLMWVVTPNAWWQDFGQMVEVVANDVDRFYGAIMAERFGIRIEDEDDDILTDDDIRRLLDAD